MIKRINGRNYNLTMMPERLIVLIRDELVLKASLLLADIFTLEDALLRRQLESENEKNSSDAHPVK